MDIEKRMNLIKSRVERIEEKSMDGRAKINVYTISNDIEWLCHVIHLQQEEIESLKKVNLRYFKALNEIEPIHKSGRVKQIAREALGNKR